MEMKSWDCTNRELQGRVHGIFGEFFEKMAQYEGMYLKSSRLLVLVEHLYCNKNSCHKWLWKYIKN